MKCRRFLLVFFVMVGMMLFPTKIKAAEGALDENFIYVSSNDEAYGLVMQAYMAMQEEPVCLYFEPGQVDAQHLIFVVRSTVHVTEGGIYTYHQMMYDGFTCWYGEDGVKIQFQWKINNSQEQVFDATVGILAPYLRGATDLDTIKNVHDWICVTTAYDDMTVAGLANRHTGYNALFENLAVCDGYATLFNKFMDKLGIPCYCATGQNHAWNLVLYQGRWYNVDCTWDDQRQGIIYNYFMY